MIRLDLKPKIHTHECYVENIFNCGFRARSAREEYKGMDAKIKKKEDDEKALALKQLNKMLQQSFEAGREYQRKSKDENQHYYDIS